MVGTIGSFELNSAVALYFGTFLHEDVAILAGSYLVVEMGLSRSLALFALYFGIVSGDVLRYGLGRIARHSARLRRLLISRRVEHPSAWLDRHLVLMRGEDFQIVEINGAGTEAIHIWDPDMSLSPG
jgi:membrane protein DedA with SNARE-associated domain